MKGVKWFKKYIIGFAILLLVFVFGSVANANAYELGAATNVYISGMHGYSSHTSASVGYPVNTPGRAYADFPHGYATSIVIDLASNIPARSIISISYSVSLYGQYTNSYTGLNCMGRCVILANEESVDDDIITGHLLLYYSQEINSIQLGTSYPIDSSIVYSFLSPVSYALVPSNLNSSPDLSSIENYLSGINTNNRISAERLLLILDAIDDLSLSIDQQQNIVDAINDTNDKLDEQNDRDQQDRDNIESQQDDISNDSDDSQDDAESTGTTLLAAFTSFVGAVTSASPSNCNLNMDLGNLDMGNVNLCQLSPPAGFSAVASIFLILFCVPLSIATARKVINLFRSFQG